MAPADDEAGAHLARLGFRQDNPAVKWGERGEEWLRNKRAEATRDPKRLRGATTGWFSGPVHIPTEMLHGVPGAMDENPRPGGQKYEWLMDSVREKGWEPDHPISIAINHHGKPYIIEGNNRAAVARALGQPTVVGDIQWMNGAEEVEGPWHPKRIAHRLMPSKRPARAAGGAVDDDNSSQRNLTPLGLYSHAADVAQRLPQMKGTPPQFKAMLLKQGVKPDELKWSKFDEAHAGKKMISRDELTRHFEQNLPRLHETTYDDSDDSEYEEDRPKYSKYALPGGKNYREMLLHLPQESRLNGRSLEAIDAIGRRMFGQRYIDLTDAQKEQVMQAQNQQRGVDFQSSHWKDTPNVVLHMRMSDRLLPADEKDKQWFLEMNGGVRGRSQWSDAEKRRYDTLRDKFITKKTKTGKILHLEELQSDWGQQGREKGFLPAANARGRIERQEGPGNFWRITWPDGTFSGGYGSQAAAEGAEAARHGAHALPIAPYVDSTQKWLDLGLKRALYEAAKGGYDKLVITPGEEQAKRYNLMKHVDELHYDPEHSFLIYKPRGKRGYTSSHMQPDKLPEAIGQELADKLLATSPAPQEQNGWAFPVHSLVGEDLHVGGHGMKAFYDRLLPQSLEKLAKKHDPEARVQLHGHALSASKMPKWAPQALHENQVEHGHGRGVRLHSLDITPKMRASILKGQPAYARGGAT